MRGRARLPFLAVAALLLACLLLSLGVPRLLAVTRLNAVSTALTDLDENAVTLVGELEGMRRDIAVAEDWTPRSPAPYLMAARVELSVRGRLYVPDANLMIMGSIEEALARAPGNPQLWATLARINQALGSAETRQRTRSALLLSLQTGRFEPFAAIRRLELAVTIWDQLEEDLQAQFPQQIAFLWSLPQMQSDLGRLYLQAQPEAQDLIRASIPQTPGQQDRLDRRIEAARTAS